MIKLYGYQRDAIKKLKSGSVLCGGVGSGKSLTALGYYLWKEHPKPLYVITIAKKRNDKEWEKDANKINASITKVDSWNNIGKYIGVRGAFFIFDEQRLTGHGAWVKSFLKIAVNNHWIMLSATPGDTWMDYIAIFIANGFYKNRTDFINQHVIISYNNRARFPQIKGYIDTPRLEFFKKEVVVQMSYVRETNVEICKRWVDYDKEKFKLVKDGRWDPYNEFPIQNVSALYYLMRKVANENPTRLNQLWEVVEKHDRVIVFYNFTYELDLLRTLGNRIVIAEHNGVKHEPIPKTDRWLYLVQYQSASEGWNCIETNVIFFYSLNYSYKVMKQASGRIDRLNTPYETLYYYIAISDSYIDRVILRALREKRKFNEREVKIEPILTS